MLEARFGEGWERTTAYGLTQWDYGQSIRISAEIDIPDGTEIQFYQNERAGTEFIQDQIARIPDAMLQSSEMITAYIYVRSTEAGETILTICLPVTARQRPENYVLPSYTSYKRLLPEGGEPGQVPRRTDIGVMWGEAADDLELTDGVLQLLSSGNPIGKRIRLPGGSGREIEMRNSGVSIQWRYTDENEWHDLIQLEEIRGPEGPAGEVPEFEIRDGHLYAIYQEGE